MIHLILNDKTFVVKYMLRVEMRNPWKFLPWLVFKYLQGKSMLETKYEGIRPCSSYLIFHTAEQKRTFQNFYLRFGNLAIFKFMQLYFSFKTPTEKYNFFYLVESHSLLRQGQNY